MLSTMRSSWLLFALLALVALSTAFSVEDALNIDGINAYLHHGVKRQAEGTGGSSSDTPASTGGASSDKPATTAPPASSASSSSSERSSSDNEASSTPPASSQNDRSSSQSPIATGASESSQDSAKSSTPSVSSKPLVSTEVAPTTYIITYISNGQSFQQTSVGSATYEHTTAFETGLASTGGSSSGGGGLSSTNKSIIGGVVGGVGGAILLGGIAVVCWRMWGRKRRVTEDDADLMAGTGSALGDKSHSSASPFQSNLEQYHNPGGRPNAAANF